MGSDYLEEKHGVESFFLTLFRGGGDFMYVGRGGGAKLP